MGKKEKKHASDRGHTPVEVTLDNVLKDRGGHGKSRRTEEEDLFSLSEILVSLEEVMSGAEVMSPVGRPREEKRAVREEKKTEREAKKAAASLTVEESYLSHEVLGELHSGGEMDFGVDENADEVVVRDRVEPLPVQPAPAVTGPMSVSEEDVTLDVLGALPGLGGEDAATSGTVSSGEVNQPGPKREASGEEDVDPLPEVVETDEAVEIDEAVALAAIDEVVDVPELAAVLPKEEAEVVEEILPEVVEEILPEVVEEILPEVVEEELPESDPVAEAAVPESDPVAEAAVPESDPVAEAAVPESDPVAEAAVPESDPVA
ncbi:MAG: hypothetical protein HQL56_02585, partial [Magnetococcales bacterium]|nr:hypothetical protein [Magnetococcales bacterium]